MRAYKTRSLATGLIIPAGVGCLGYFSNAVAPMASGFKGRRFRQGPTATPF